MGSVEHPLFPGSCFHCLEDSSKTLKMRAPMFHISHFCRGSTPPNPLVVTPLPLRSSNPCSKILDLHQQRTINDQVFVCADDYVINGSKMWITNGLQAHWICLLANTSDGPAHLNKSLICVPMDLPGVQRARNIQKIGMHSSDTAELYFEDVVVPQSFRIGKEGAGFTYQMLQFVEERVFAGACCKYFEDLEPWQTL